MQHYEIKTINVLSSANNFRVSEIFLRNQHTNRQVMPEICRFIQILKVLSQNYILGSNITFVVQEVFPFGISLFKVDE